MKNKKIKELVSKPAKTKRVLVNSISTPTSKDKNKRTFSKGLLKDDDFIFEVEAARMAHLNGWDEVPHMSLDIDEHEPNILEEEVVKRDDENLILVDNHQDVIEKFSKSYKKEEKEGWEAFYE